jgi:toxin ParE1/3/4
MKPRIIRSQRAKLEIARIGDYIGQRNIDAGLRFFDAAEDAFQRLADMPMLGALLDSSDPKAADLRVWTIRGFENYLVLYRALPDGIEVARVVDGRRDIEKLLRREA